MAATKLSAGMTFGSKVFKNVGANYTVLPVDMGKIIYCTAADLVITLPLAENHTGQMITVMTGALSSGTGTSISPAASNNITGAAKTAVDDKDLINTGSTDSLGDCATLISNGTDWVIYMLTGTWAKES